MSRNTTPPAVPTAAADLADPKPPPEVSASEAGLRYTSPDSLGILRVKHGAGFVYKRRDGTRVTDAATLQRIAALVIPPRWRDVRIATSPNDHVQAVGRDERGRKQYRYHARWRQVRDETKFSRMLAFGRAISRIRARTRRDLAQRGMPRTKVLAAIVQLLERTAVRIGNEEYARTNGSIGLTTMRNRHVRVRGRHIAFDFVGKGGKKHRIALDDDRLAAVVRRCQDLPGQELFQYVDEDGELQRVTSDTVNAYVREISGMDFTAKDFRTWAGTVIALGALREAGPCDTDTAGKRAVIDALDAAASALGNTRAICRASYVHPAVTEAYQARTLFTAACEARRQRGVRHCSPDERALLALLDAAARSARRAANRTLPRAA